MAGIGAAGMSGNGVSGLGEPAPINAGGVLGPLARAQYRALARLRWQMFTNGLRSNKGALELGARTFSYIVYTVMGLGVGAGAATATYFLVSGNQWRFLPVEFWVLGFIWQMIPVMLASFQEQFDLGILLRFPVRFGSYVLLYIVFGLVDVSTILGGLFCAGIWFGVAAARPGLLLWASLALAVFAAFNFLLVRAIFAWIERWLAQRRTREILGAFFMVGLLSLQLLNPAIYQKRHSERSGHQEQAEQLRAAKARYAPLLRNVNAVQKWLPPGLAAQSLQQAVAHQPDAGLGSLGLLGLYALLAGGILAIRLRAEYRGESLSVAPSRVVASAGRGMAEVIPSVVALDAGGEQTTHSSGPIAAIMEKDVRSLLRTLPLLYAIGAPLLLVLVFSSIFLRNGAVQTPVFPLALPICMVYAQLGFTQIFFNSLGAEGAGIQLYFLSPTPFRTILLAKNILHSMLFAVVATVAGVLTTLRLGVPDGAVVAATAAWLMFLLPCNLAAGNIFSIRLPYRVNPGRISRQRGSQANALLSLLVQLGIIAVGAAVFTLCWYLDRMWMAVPTFLALAVVAVFVWRQVLNNADALANERRDVLMATLMKAT